VCTIKYNAEGEHADQRRRFCFSLGTFKCRVGEFSTQTEPEVDLKEISGLKTFKNWKKSIPTRRFSASSVFYIFLPKGQIVVIFNFKLPVQFYRTISLKTYGDESYTLSNAV